MKMTSRKTADRHVAQRAAATAVPVMRSFIAIGIMAFAAVRISGLMASG
jgi:hypothetical protein